MGPEDCETIAAIAMEDPERIGMMVSSTPTGSRGMFYRICTELKFNKDEEVVIRRVMDDTSILNYMSSIGLTIGDTINITEVDEFNELILFTINDKTDTHHISFKQAQIIFSY